MELLSGWFEQILEHLTWIGVLIVGLVVLTSVRLYLNHRDTRAGRDRFRNPVVMLVLSLGYVLLLIMVLPVGDTMRGQLLGLLGILLSAAIALSSTTFLGNVMAGLMLRGIRSFRAGDFIRIQDHFGRVSGLGMLSTEIQTEERDLVTLPNLFLVTKPLRVIRPSGTIVSTTVSLGYDIPQATVKTLLLRAISESGLIDGFAQVNHLGDHSVTYRAAGLLTDVKQMLSVQARLRALVLDSLHRGEVEIVSPTFRNVRSIAKGQKFIPEVPEDIPREMEDDSVPEEVVFDKADKAESVEKTRAESQELEKQITAVKENMKTVLDSDERRRLKNRLARLERKQSSLQRLLEVRENEVQEGE